MSRENEPRSRRGRRSSSGLKKDPSLLLQEYLSSVSSPEETLFRLNELLYFQKHTGTRKNIRIPLSVPVTVRVGGAVLQASSYTISREGMFIKTPAPPPSGTMVEASFSLPREEHVIEVEGEVVHSAGLEEAMKRANLSGMAIVFRKISSADQKRIERAVKEYLRKRSFGSP